MNNSKNKGDGKLSQLLGGIDSNFIRLILIFLVICAFGGIARTGTFLNAGNFQSIGKQLSEYGLMALGWASA